LIHGSGTRLRLCGTLTNPVELSHQEAFLVG